MSDGERPERGWWSFISDMIASGESILAFTDGMNVEEFVNDQRTYKATLWDLRIIGEAATHIPKEVRNTNPEFPWSEVIAMRNRIIHAYEAIDVDIVWDTVKTDIPQMIIDLRELSKRLEEEQF